MRCITKLLSLLIVVFAYCTSAQAQAIAIGDLNGDGRPDVVVINSSTNVGVYLNQGSGALGTGAFFAVLPLAGPGALTLLDVNGDGFKDIVLADSTQVQVLLGDGHGAFGAPTAVSLAPFGASSNLVVADFNGDGILDLAFGVSNAVSAAFPPTIGILPGNGHGGFGPVQLFTVTFNGRGVSQLVLVDANKDSKPDLGVTVVSSLLGRAAYLVLNDGAGNFEATSLAGEVLQASCDFNNDGNPDFASPLASQTGNANILYGDGQGGILFSSRVSGGTLACADFDNSGTADLLNFTGNMTSPDYMPGNGHGGFGDLLPFSPTFSGKVVAVADMDGDGQPDLILLDSLTFTPSIALNKTLPPGVVQASTLTVISTSASTATIGQTVTLIASVSSDGGTPVGTVSFSEGATVLGSAPLNVYGLASLDTVVTTSGTHTFSANFTGGVDATTNTTFGNSSSGGGGSVFANNSPPAFGAPTVTLTSAVNPARELNPVAFNVGVSSPSGTPIGVFVLRADGAVIAQAPVSQSAIGVTFPNPGLHNIQATYGGDGLFPPANSPTIVEDIRAFTAVRSAPTVSLNVTPSGNSFNLAASLVGVSNPSANFIYRVNGTFLATLLVGQPATFTPPTQGTYNVVAQYEGDAALLPARASSKIVVGNPGGDFSLSTQPSSVTLAAGQTATFTITISPSAGFNSATTFSCAGLPAASSCSFSPASITPNGTPVSTTLTITTTARSAASSTPVSGPVLWSFAAVLAFVMLSLMLVDATRLRKIIAVGAATAIVMFALVAVGCGGGGGTPGPPPITGTLAGSYQITVAATSAGVSHNLNLAVTVQ
jgi:FG-GAP-like repeat/Bacterial Ig-like domain (group 3)